MIGLCWSFIIKLFLGIAISLLVGTLVFLGYIYFDTQNREIVQELGAKNMALTDCVKCKLQTSYGFFFYTCNGTEYRCERLEWVNLNATECK